MSDGVREMRLCVTAADYDEALVFYRDVLGMREVDDSAEATQRLTEAGATVIAPPTETPWRSLNARLEAPAGLQLTLFQALAGPEFTVSDS